MNTKAALEEAVSRAGGVTRMAEAVGVVQPAVSNWLSRGRTPANKCLKIQQLTGVSVHRLRPDVFGPPEEVA